MKEVILNLIEDTTKADLNIKVQGLSCAVHIEEWPRTIESDLAWDPERLGLDADFILHLGPNEVIEVQNALQHFNGRYY
jgi:hypothetical protein